MITLRVRRFSRLALLAACVQALFAPLESRATTYYIDCSATYNGDGSAPTQASSTGAPGAYNSSTSINSHSAFVSGDQILFRRGGSSASLGVSVPCGAVQPPGSSSSMPIIIDAYCQPIDYCGPMPVVDGGTSTAAIQLANQSGWTIQNLEVRGGNNYGVLVQATLSSISNITLNNVDVHGANGSSSTRDDSAEVAFIAGGGYTISGLNLFGVQTHDSRVSDGILVAAGDSTSPSGVKGSEVEIADALAYNLYGDGIVVGDVNTAVIRNATVHDTGECISCTGITPDGFIVFNSSNVTLQGDESYNNQSWGVGGGGFSVSIWNSNVTLEYSYAHDNKSYCVDVLGTGLPASAGGGSYSTSNTIIRYNICSNNNTSSDSTNAISTLGNSDIVLSTWKNGAGGGDGYLNGVQIYNNTSYWNPSATEQAASASELWEFANLSGSSNIYENNIVYASSNSGSCTCRYMTDVWSPFDTIDHNIYWTPSGSLAWFWFSGGTGQSAYAFSSYQTGSGYDMSGQNSDPSLNTYDYHAAAMPTAVVSLPNTVFIPQSGSPAMSNGAQVCSGTGCAGTRDFFGNPLPTGNTGWDIGAYQH